MTTIVIHANHSTVAELKAYEEMIDANRENIVPYSDFFKLEAKQQGVTARIREYEMCIRDRVYTVQNPFRSQRLQR